MAYIPAYNAIFAKPLLNQLIAIIQRDQASVIALVNPALAAIAEFHKGPGVRTAFPWLTLAVDGIAFEPETWDARHAMAHVSLTLETGQFDQEMAQDNAQDYARALDMIITTSAHLNYADFTTALPITHETVPSGVTTPGAVGTVKNIFVDAHRYFLARSQAIDIPVLGVTIDLRFELEET